MGGSQGAVAINGAVRAVTAHYAGRPQVQLYQLTGKKQWEVVTRATLSFDGYNYFQIDPEGQESGKPDPIWTQYGYKVKINFYRPDAVQFDEYGHEKTDSDLLRGYPTNESFGIYLADFEWGIYQIAIALNYRADYFNPHFATIPVKSTDDDYFHGFGGAKAIDGKPVSVSSSPKIGRAHV